MRMGEEQERTFHQQMNVVVGTMGAITFAGLILVLEHPQPFTVQNSIFLTPHQSFDLLILLMATVSVLSMLSALIAAMVGGGMLRAGSPAAYFSFIGGVLSVGGFAFSLEIIVGDFTFVGGNIFTVVLAAVFILFVYVVWKSELRI